MLKNVRYTVLKLYLFNPTIQGTGLSGFCLVFISEHTLNETHRIKRSPRPKIILSNPDVLQKLDTGRWQEELTKTGQTNECSLK